jgi:protein-tyrosine phosphatase
LKIRHQRNYRSSELKEIAKKPDHLPEGIVYKNYSAFEDKGDQLDQAKKLV